MENENDSQEQEPQPKMKLRPGRNGGKIVDSYIGMKSPNPNGRPKGSLNSKTIITKYLGAQSKFQNDITGKEETMTVLDKMVVKQIHRAVHNGDINAFNALLDRMEGKPKQIQELTGKDGTPQQMETTHTVVFKNYAGGQLPAPSADE